MRFIHLSDLHLGKRVKDFSMLEDQRFILAQILDIIDSQKADAVIIAGDVYDKPIPPAEAVEVFDNFLFSLSQRSLRVFIISGNHDSAERIAFGARLMDKSGIHLSPVYDGKVDAVRLEDRFGPVNVYMLPFIKPIHVRHAFPEAEIGSLNEAIALAVEKMELEPAERNVLITHQFVSGAESCESEISVGGTDSLDHAILDGFDYVALGHLHGPQSIGRESIRYCGTPLKYSFSEAAHQKSVTVVDMNEKGSIEISTVPLKPLRDMLKLRGSYEELLSREFYESLESREAYLQISLTDEEELPGALSCLRLIYPNIMKLEYDNIRSREIRLIEGLDGEAQKSPLEIFSELYELQNNRPMSDTQLAYMSGIIEELGKEAY